MAPCDQAPGHRQPVVLVADDEPGIVEFLRYALEDNGFQVLTAQDGSEALDLYLRERPDMLVTDLMMPRLSGWELVRRLRADHTLGEPVIIGMSAVEPNGVAVDAFLRKPFELDELLGLLGRFAERNG